MPYTTPLKDKPTAYPNPVAPIVDKNGVPTPEFNNLIQQLKDWIKPADDALRQLEP